MDQSKEKSPSKKNFSFFKKLIQTINNVGVGNEFSKTEIISNIEEKRTDSYLIMIFSLLKRCDYIKRENLNVYRLLKKIDENKSLMDIDIEAHQIKD